MSHNRNRVVDSSHGGTVRRRRPTLIRRSDSRAIEVHSQQTTDHPVRLESSPAAAIVVENALKKQQALEKQLSEFEDELRKVDRQIKIIDDLPDGDPRKVFVHRSCCGKCVDRFFGTTPQPQPCGSWQYQIMWILSGVFISLLKYGFCITSALIIHDSSPVFVPSETIGLNIQLMSMFVTQLIIAPASAIGSTIAGPELIASIFQADMAEIIAAQTESTPERALPTLLFCMAMTTFSYAVVWLLLGYLRGTRIVDYMPVCVVSGFMGCIAYKVMYYGVKLSVGKLWYEPGTWAFWKLLLPVIPLGVGLHYLKKFHHTLHINPLIVVGVFLIIPPVLVYIAMAAMGADIETLRDDGWMISPAMNQTNIGSQWTELNFFQLDPLAIGLCIPPMLGAVLMDTIALLINLQTTKQGLEMPEVDAAHEMKLNGWANIVATVCMSAPGYSQVKFTMLNFHVTHNRNDKKPGLFAAAFAITMLLGGFLLINFLPRLTLGMLLVYAGLPLVEEHLILAYRRVAKKEFVAIWIIFLVNAVAGVYTPYSLLIAVGVGVVLATLIFSVQYGRNPVIRDQLSGRDYQSAVVRPLAEQKLVERIGIRLRIVELEGFLFFGSANQVFKMCANLLRKNHRLPFPERVRYLLIDFARVINIDHSSCKGFAELLRDTNAAGVVLVLTGMNPKVFARMQTHGVIDKSKQPGQLQQQQQQQQQHQQQQRQQQTSVVDEQGLALVVHSDLDHGAEYVETQLLKRASRVRDQWLVFDSFRKLHAEALIKTTCETFEAVIGSDVGTNLWKYTTLRTLQTGQVLCRQGTMNSTLFVLQEGVLTSFITDRSGKRRRIHKMTRGAFVNDECLILDLPVPFSVVANRRCVLWAISRASMKHMEAHDPHLALEILRKVLAHTSIVRSRLEREVKAVQSSLGADDVATTPHRLQSTSSATNMEASHKLGRSILKTARSSGFGEDEEEDIIMAISAMEAAHSNGGSNSGDGEDGDETVAYESGHAVGWASGDHHRHHFRHLHVPSPSSPRLEPHGRPPLSPGQAARVQQELARFRPHLSKNMEEDARRCFFYHAQRVPLDDDGDDEGVSSEAFLTNDARADRHAAISAAAAAAETENVHNHQHSHAAAVASARGQMLPLSELEKAVMDLGVFPSHDEIETMHMQLSKRENRAAGGGRLAVSSSLSGLSDEEGYVDLEEFLEMIRLLKLAHIDNDAKRELYKMYRHVCNDEGLLSRDNLSELMTSLGHPEDEVELESLMHNWDVKGRQGFLDFDAFLSIVSATLKAEELQVQCEEDFKLFIPQLQDASYKSRAWNGAESKVQDQRKGVVPRKVETSHTTNQRSRSKSQGGAEELKYLITVEDLLRVFSDLRLHLSREVAEEMLFDADLSSCGGVDYDDLISCIETIGTDEVYRAMKTNRTGLRAIQEAKMGDKFKVAMDSAAQVDQSPIADGGGGGGGGGAVHTGVSPAAQSTASPLSLPATTEDSSTAPLQLGSPVIRMTNSASAVSRSLRQP